MMPGKTLNTKIYSLYSSVGNLRLSSAYNLKSTTVSDTTKATVTASNTAPSKHTDPGNVISVAQATYLTILHRDSSGVHRHDAGGAWHIRWGW